MALISAKTIITSVSLFHVTLAFFFLTNPSSVDKQALVYMLGEAMGMPYARGFDVPSAPLALLAVVFILIGFSDLVSLSMPEEVSLILHWGTQAPLRFTVSLALTVYVIVCGPSSPIFSDAAHSPSWRQPSWGDGLKNRLFFTFAFLETITWFWIWVTLREEREAIQSRKSRKRRSSQAF